MAVNIKNKRSKVQGKAPDSGVLAAGEIGVNYNENSPALYIEDDAGNVVTVAGGVTDLDVGNITATTLDVTNSTGTDATLPAATDATAGLLSATDKSKLDGYSANPLWEKDGGNLQPVTAGDNVEIGGGNISLVAADGSATFEGGIDVAEASIFGSTVMLPVTAPVSDGQAANKKYVDDVAANAVISGDAKYVLVAGDNMSGNLTLGTDKITLNATNGNATFAGVVAAEGLTPGYITVTNVFAS